MKILVTGAAGFIGGYLYKELKKYNHEVKGIDNFTNPSYAHYNIYNEIENKDVRHYKFTEDFDVVFHLAAFISVDESLDQQKEVFDVNLYGTLNLLSQLINKKTKFIFASSSEIYGTNSEPGKQMFEYHNTSPRSPYGISKLSADHLVQNYRILYNMDTIVVRHFNITGFGQSRKAVVTRMITDAIQKDTITINGDGKQIRDYTLVQDAVDFYIRSLCLPSGVYNNGSGYCLEIEQLAHFIKIQVECCYNKKIKIRYGIPRLGEVRELRSNIINNESEKGSYEKKIRNEIDKIIFFIKKLEETKND